MDGTEIAVEAYVQYQCLQLQLPRQRGHLALGCSSGVAFQPHMHEALGVQAPNEMKTKHKPTNPG